MALSDAWRMAEKATEAMLRKVVPMVHGSGFRVLGLGLFRVQDSGFRVRGIEFRVQARV